jgi:hypothetical protein
MSSRRLRVSYYGSRGCYRDQPWRPLPPMPFLRLQGRWLDRAGFAIGSDVRVQVEYGRLVLEVIDPPLAADSSRGATASSQDRL